MSILNNEEEFDRALKKAYEEFPPHKYSNNMDECCHNYDFVIYCDGEYDIVRCRDCGKEIVVLCSFDADYD